MKKDQRLRGVRGCHHEKADGTFLMPNGTLFMPWSQRNSSLRDAKGRIVNAKTPKERTDQPLRPRNRRVTRRSDLGRTLFTAGVFALLSMIFAPKAHYGYRLIFSAEATSHCVLSIDGKRWVRGTPGRNSGDNHAEDRSRSSRTAPVGLARDRRNRRDRPLLSIRAVA
jgi:hypothetical protein